MVNIKGYCKNCEEYDEKFAYCPNIGKSVEKENYCCFYVNKKIEREYEGKIIAEVANRAISLDLSDEDKEMINDKN